MWATNNTVDMETEPFEIQFENGSDHAVVASYSELYEEGEVEHINGPSLPPCVYWKYMGILVERVEIYGLGKVAGMQQVRSESMQ